MFIPLNSYKTNDFGIWFVQFLCNSIPVFRMPSSNAMNDLTILFIIVCLFTYTTALCTWSAPILISMFVFFFYLIENTATDAFNSPRYQVYRVFTRNFEIFLCIYFLPLLSDKLRTRRPTELDYFIIENVSVLFPFCYSFIWNFSVWNLINNFNSN